MDSRTREALEISRDYIIDAINIRISTYGEKFRSSQLAEMRNDLALVESELALLTAEPEPCEDAYEIAADIRIESRLNIPPRDEDLDHDAAKIEAYASQVADKRVEELRAQVETLREALKKIDHIECEALAESTGLPVKDFTRGYAGSGTVSGVAREALAATEPKT